MSTPVNTDSIAAAAQGVLNSPIEIDAASCGDGGIKIVVHDQGIGIPADEVDTLLTRFFRASTSMSIAGTGIGLHMTQAFVDMHGG